jgi:hypothetical protein
MYEGGMDSAGSGWDPVAAVSCEYFDELSDSIKVG